MNLLRPEFVDRKKCARCGSPAARLLRRVEDEKGNLVFTPDCVELTRTRDEYGHLRPVRFDDKGAATKEYQKKTSSHGRYGEESATSVFYVLPITHECPTCGGLTHEHTTAAREMPDECWYEPAERDEPTMKGGA